MPLRSSLALLSLLAISLASLAQSPWQDPRLAAACILDSLGKHERALAMLEQLSHDPSIRSAALNRMAGCEFEHLHKADAAFAHIREAIIADPKDAANYIDRASMYQSIGMPDRSLEDLLEARSLADTLPERMATELNIGAIHLQLRRFEEALVQFDRVLRMDSTDIAALVDKSHALSELGRKEEAMTILLDLHKREPKNTVHMNNLGFLLSGMERYPEAIDWYDKGIALAKDDPFVLNNRAYARLKVGDTGGALKDVQRSIKLYPANAYAHRNLGLVLQARGEKNKACDAFEEAMRRGYTEQYGTDVKEVHHAYCR